MDKIRLSGVSKRFGAIEVLSDVDLTIQDEEFVVFVGPSGCGKSTLLRLITGLEEVSDGQILIDGTDVSRRPPAERQLAMVFQSYALYPHMSVRRNIGFGLKVAGVDKASIERRVNEAAAMLELTDYLDRKPKELSGGQRQRVAIGRAIVRSPVAFLFDEPLSNLDAALRVQMRMELIRLHQSLRKTMVYVTHDQTEAMTMADRIVVLNAGRVEQFDSPIALYDRPANLFVAGFIGSPKMNFFEVKSEDASAVRFVDGETIRLASDHGGAIAQATTLGVRPEHIDYSHADGLWEGEISIQEQLGSDALFHVEVPSIGRITVRAVGERGFHTGDRIYLTPQPERCHLFERRGQAVRHGEPADQAGSVSSRQGLA